MQQYTGQIPTRVNKWFVLLQPVPLMRIKGARGLLVSDNIVKYACSTNTYYMNYVGCDVWGLYSVFSVDFGCYNTL